MYILAQGRTSSTEPFATSNEPVTTIESRFSPSAGFLTGIVMAGVVVVVVIIGTILVCMCIFGKIHTKEPSQVNASVNERYVNYTPTNAQQVHYLERSREDPSESDPIANYHLYSQIDEFDNDVQIQMKTNEAYNNTTFNIPTEENEAYGTSDTPHSTNTVESENEYYTYMA